MSYDPVIGYALSDALEGRGLCYVRLVSGRVLHEIGSGLQTVERYCTQANYSVCSVLQSTSENDRVKEKSRWLRT